MNSYFSHGKLLITGEYVVLDNALSLALPTKFGQKLEVDEDLDSEHCRVSWQSFDSQGELWFSETYIIGSDTLGKLRPENFDACNINPVNEKLLEILNKAKELNPAFLSQGSFEVRSTMDFPNNWGLGSSSTLICNIAKWAEVDAFQLSAASFGGSGYDIAVGMLGGDILYRNPEMWEGYVYNPSFRKQLYFVHLNKKQNSREGIQAYRGKPKNEEIINRISRITEELIACSDFNAFQLLITEHEKRIGECIGQETIKNKLFSDYPFAIKSLGAWGGDFILACGDDNTESYFNSKGYPTVLTFNEMIK
ncbi:MAG: GHMP kinase [Bacteroidia bacterium]|nr:GHMP kinase [Bacteroidia bacterium]NNJ55131.1 GHMP kinase [Bacteroidia bacterium]